MGGGRGADQPSPRAGARYWSRGLRGRRSLSVRRAFSGATWEEQVGYCRALRTGDRVFVTGTASVASEGGVHAVGKPYEQAKRCLEIIADALAEMDATMADVTRTRMFVTDIARWEDFGRAHREAFELHPPTTTMVEVSRLIHPDMLIEIEADAVVGE